MKKIMSLLNSPKPFKVQNASIDGSVGGSCGEKRRGGLPTKKNKEETKQPKNMGGRRKKTCSCFVEMNLLVT